jgi:hypothetical protein
MIQSPGGACHGAEKVIGGVSGGAFLRDNHTCVYILWEELEE